MHSTVLISVASPPCARERRRVSDVDPQTNVEIRRQRTKRHAAASLFIETLQWSPKRIQSVMGHSSITMTYDRYGHLFADPEGDKEAMKRLEAAIVAA